jgi:excisionase family DNA binding protein
MKQDLIHIKEAAKLLGVTRQAVYKKLQSHGLKPQKVGNKAYIDKDTLRAIKEGKKVQPSATDGVTSATKQVDNELINLLSQQLEDLKNDKLNLQKQVEIKDRQIEDLSTSGREMRLLLGAAQKQIGGLLPSPAEPHKPVYEPPPPDHNQPEKPAKKSKKKRKKKKR